MRERERDKCGRFCSIAMEKVAVFLWDKWTFKDQFRLNREVQRGLQTVGGHESILTLNLGRKWFSSHAQTLVILQTHFLFCSLGSNGQLLIFQKKRAGDETRTSNSSGFKTYMWASGDAGTRFPTSPSHQGITCVFLWPTEYLFIQNATAPV